MPYVFLDEVITREEFWHQSYQQMLEESFWYERDLIEQGQSPLPEEQKRAWLDKYFRLRAVAVFKWQVAPPILIVDGYGITAAEYNQPIVTRFKPQGYTDAEILQYLKSVMQPETIRV